MSSDLISISFHKIMQSHAYTVIILGTEEKKFAIYTEPHIGKDIQTYLTEGKKPRPSTHELIRSIWKGYDIQPMQIVIHNVEDTVYFARLFLERKQNDLQEILEIDARPSDCIVLALMDNVPVFCRKEVLEKSIAVQDT